MGPRRIYSKLRTDVKKKNFLLRYFKTDMPLDESILCLIPKMNVTAQVVKQTPFVTLCITSLTLVLQVYIWNDSEKQQQHSLMATTSGSRLFKT
jgi:hypothetical protein